MIFIFLWLISPIVLLILFLVQLSKTSDLKRVNKELNEKINKLISEKGNEVNTVQAAQPVQPDLHTEEPVPETKATESSSVAEQVCEPASPPQNTFGYDMPYAIPQTVNAYAEKPKEISKEAPANMPEPVKVTEVPKQKNSVSTINIILILGALLISLSGVIFAVAAWGALNTFFKAVVLLSFSAVFFGIHSFTERKLKLAQTGRVFYVLGSIFLPAAVAAAGILKVFGEYLSFSGDGWRLVLSAIFLSVCIPFLKGAHDYKSKPFADIFLCSFSAFVISLIWHFSPSGDVSILICSIFALILSAAEPAVKKVFDMLFGENNVFSAVYSRFAALNAAILGIISMTVFAGDRNGILTLAAFAVFSVCFLTKNVTEKSGAFGALSFAFFITVSLFSGFEPDEVSGYACVIAATSLIYAVLSAMGIFPEILRKIMKILAITAACVSGILGISENIILISENSAPSWQLVIAAAAVYTQLLMLTLRHKTTAYKALSFGAMLWLSADIVLLISHKTDLGCIGFVIAYAVMLAYFAATRFTGLKKQLYTSVNDIIIAIYAFIFSASCFIGDFDRIGAVLGLLLIIISTVLCAASKCGTISMVSCPTLAFLTVFPLAVIFDGVYVYVLAYVIMLAYFAATRFTGLKKSLYTPVNDIIIAIYAFVCSRLCCTEYDGRFFAIAILLAGIICAAFSNRGKISAAVCPVLTFQLTLPLSLIFEDYNLFSENGAMAMSLTVILICIIASVMLFIPKARSYAISYGIAVIAVIPIFGVSSILWETYYFLPMLSVTAYTALYLARSAFPQGKYSYINLLNAVIVLTSLFIGAGVTDSVYLLCFPAAAVILIFAAYLIGIAFDVFEKTQKHIEHFVWYAASILGGIMLFVGNDEANLAVCIIGIVLMVGGLFTSICRRNTMNMIFPLFSAVCVSCSYDKLEAMLALTAVLVVCGHVLFRRKMFENLYSDVFSVGAFVPSVIYIINAETDLKRWLALIILALVTLNLLRSEHSSAANKVCLTASSAFIFPIVWVQPFFELPDMIDVQFNLLPVVIFCVLLRLIWKDAPEKVDNFSFVAAIFSLVVLFIDSLTSGEAFAAVFIGVVLFIMLAVSFIIKKKRWFVLAVASMVASAVLLSFGQRDSIAWLVYLALTGAALIALGVVNELKKQQKRSGEDTKLTRFMSDWTW